jgi:hypothetical protein
MERLVRRSPNSEGGKRNSGPPSPHSAALHAGYDSHNPLHCPTGKTRKHWVNRRESKYSTLPKFGFDV